MKQYKISYLKNSKIYHCKIFEDQLQDFKYDIIKIKSIEKQNLYFNIFSKLNSEDILQIFSQINIMLQANISLLDTIDTLILNEKNSKKLKILKSMQNRLQKGELFEKELFQYVDKLIINFLLLGQKNGNIKEVIKIIVNILEKKEQAKRQFLEAVSYPIFLTITFLISLGVIFGYVIPQFEPLFLQYGSNLPFATKLLLEFKEIINSYGAFILLFGLFAFAFLYYIYKKSATFKLKFDKFLLVKLPIVSKLILLSNLLILFLSLKLLLNQKYKFQEALSIGIDIIQNSYLKNIFYDIQKDILNGKSIQNAFEKKDIFDDIIKKLIVIGHRSDQFELVLDKIVYIYEVQYDKKLKKTIRLVEPLFLILIASVIIWVMLAIFVPMWDMNKVM